MTSVLVSLALIVLLLVGGYRLLLWGFRVPRRGPSADPATFGRCFVEVVIPTVRGRSLAGWLLPAAPAAPAVVMIHGWGAGADSLLPIAARLNRAGFSVLMIDARCHGRSDDDDFASMPRFAEDLEAALDWLKRQPAPAPAAVAVLGHSVGGAAALLAASRRDDLAAVISLSAFDHPERVMRLTLERAGLPYRPFGWAVCRIVERLIGHRFDAIAPVATIAGLRCPVLIGHGAMDELVPPDAARAIAAAGRSDRVRLEILEGTTHDRPPRFDGLVAPLIAFLNGAVRR